MKPLMHTILLLLLGCSAANELLAKDTTNHWLQVSGTTLERLHSMKWHYRSDISNEDLDRNSDISGSDITLSYMFGSSGSLKYSISYSFKNYRPPKNDDVITNGRTICHHIGGDITILAERNSTFRGFISLGMQFGIMNSRGLSPRLIDFESPYSLDGIWTDACVRLRYGFFVFLPNSPFVLGASLQNEFGMSYLKFLYLNSEPVNANFGESTMTYYTLQAGLSLAFSW